jgi:hypothetical protein
MSDQRVHVLGQQMADARRKEEERLLTPGVEESPLAGRSYDKWAGEFDLSDPRHSPLDDKLVAFCRRFAASDADARRLLRRSISMDELYTLIAFANRCAVFAIRSRAIATVEDGLVALAAIDPSRIDFRDAVSSINLLDHAARAIGAKASGPFTFAASLADETMGQRILEFTTMPYAERDIRTMSGYVQVETDHGPGFMRWNLEPYRPTVALDRVASALSRLIAADKYEPSSIALASKLPAVWFSKGDTLKLEHALHAVRAGVSISAELRPSDTYDYMHQKLLAFLVELKNDRFADDLYRVAENTHTIARPFAIMAAVSGRLFCLIVGRSFVMGTSNHETDASLHRFAAGVTRLLEDGLRSHRD